MPQWRKQKDRGLRKDNRNPRLNCTKLQKEIG